MAQIIHNVGKLKKLLATTVRKAYYHGRELSLVDYSETTAWSHFCRIRFRWKNEEFWIPSHDVIFK